jgi:hypothetical protein
MVDLTFASWQHVCSVIAPLVGGFTQLLPRQLPFCAGTPLYPQASYIQQF